NHVMTCAHVVADALGIERNTFEKPAGIVKLDFPLLEHQPGVKARVIKWFPIKENAVTGDLEDITVLEVLPESPLPGNITPVPVVLLESHLFFDRSVRMCGFPYGGDEGTYANGTLQGPTGKGWIEIQHDLAGGMVQEGFSGTAAWDKKENAVSGMIVSTMSHSGQETAYMIPVESLIRAFPQLDSHSRPPNPYKGLEAFYEKDAPFFFGRETVIEDLAGIVQKHPFVAVIGASGSGKSSTILA
ncbi:MAG: serine protease, partial [bacterium]|nr:serine protease [bacterium]